MLKKNNNNQYLFFSMLLACVLLSAIVRYQQFETWKKTPNAFFVGERPMMTTLDAPYWLRLARQYNEGTYGMQDRLRGYPEGTDNYQKKSLSELSIPLKYTDQTSISSNDISLSSSGNHRISYKDVPLLSFLIALLSPIFNHNYYLTGTLLVPLFASLFILPLGAYFFRVGLPVSGLLGGLIGTFAGGYYMRSSIGRIDTDMLNLFFPALSAFMILQAVKSKTQRIALVYSIGTGLSSFLFQWWYGKPGFTIAFFSVLVFSLCVHKFSFRTILFGSLLYILCTHPSTFMGGTQSVQNFWEGYFTIESAQEVQITNETNKATFPNTRTTISEVDKVEADLVFRRILSNKTFALLGLLAFFVLGVLYWRMLLPLLPMLALGLFSFQSSNRFIMYLAPFIGVGLGWIISLLIEGLFHFLPRKEIEDTKKKDKKRAVSKSVKYTRDSRQLVTKFTEINWSNWVRQGVLYLGMGLFFWGISSQTAISFVPGPSIHPRLYATFFEVKKLVPKSSALLTWWDYGYAITDVTGLASFHDGGSQQGPKTYFTARALISGDAKELYDISQYLATEGNRGISEENTSPEALMLAVRNPKHKPWDPIYLFFTADMTGKFGAISKLGSWDIEKGGSKPRAYQNLACNKITNQEMICRGAKIDLKAGLINNQLTLRRLIFIRNGQVLRVQKFGHNQGFTLQLIVVGNNIVEVQLIDEEVFLSNYNQMFLLGRYRKDLFEETYNGFPFSRLYRINY